MLKFFVFFLLFVFMALFKLGAVITEGRGKLGGHSLQMQGGRLVCLTNSKPRKVISPLQQRSRAFHRSVIQYWRVLTDLNKSLWNKFAASCDYGLFCSNVKRPSGFNLFCAANKNRLPFLTIGITRPIIPAAIVLPSFTSVVFTASLSRLRAVGKWLNYSGWYFTYYASPPMSAGRVPKKGEFRYLGVTTMTSLTQVFTNVNYVKVYGFTPHIGSVIFARFKLVHAASGACTSFFEFRIVCT